MMYSVIIVDDDMIVRTFLSEMLDWNKYQLEVVGAAHNGEMAWKMIQEKHPDVVLTDISMPKMDGIELIQQLRSEGFLGVIDVISCHDDFELVKAAMKQGADDYILKNHLTGKNAETVLEKLTEQIKQKNIQAAHDTEIKAMVRRGINSIRQSLMQRVLAGELAGAELSEQLENAGLSGGYRRMAVMLIQPEQLSAEKNEMLLSLCTQSLENEKAEIFLLHEDVSIVLIDLSSSPSVQQNLQEIYRLQSMIENIAAEYMNTKISAAISGICDGDNAVATALRQADEMLKNRFYGSGSWLYGIEKPMAHELPEEAVVFERNLEEQLAKLDEDAVLKSSRSALEAIQRERVLPGVVLLWLRRCDRIAGIQRTEKQYSNMKHFADFADCGQQYIEHRLTNKRYELPQNISPMVNRGIQYIHSHFSEQIGLDDVAQEVLLSSPYFSRMFKQEMGVGFSEYLQSIRIEFVCRRLRVTDLTIKQIAEAAGFSDYPYFCKAFKKHLGVSPAVYRKTKR